MAKEKKEDEGIPECIKKYKKIKSSAEEIIHTIDNSHRAAWVNAEKEVLMEKGRIKMDKLKDLKTRLKFADTIANYYDDQIKGYFSVKADLDEGEKELLRNAYAGTTKQALRQTAAKHGKDFTFEKFYNSFAQGDDMKRIQHNLRSAAYNHFSPDHIDDILKYTKSTEHFNSDALKEKPDVALGILEQFEAIGGITKKYIDKLFEGDPEKRYFLKKEKKKAA